MQTLTICDERITRKTTQSDRIQSVCVTAQKRSHGSRGLEIGTAFRTTTTKTNTNNNNTNNNSSNDSDNYNRNMNNSNNTYNCNNHNNRYNSRYTKGISNISTCTYISFFKPTYVGTVIDNARKPLLLFLITLSTILGSCDPSRYIYRVEYKDGTVEYYETQPDTTGVNTFFKIRTDRISDYER